MKFYSPYQFIPLKKPTQTVEYAKIKDGEADYIRHDRWDDEAYSGRILCKLKTISPLVIGKEQERKNGVNKPAEVIPYRNKQGLALPANSLRGMIGNVVETLSHSSLRVRGTREEHTYSVRKPMGDSLKAIGLLQEGEQGWIIKPLAMVAMPLKNNKVPSKWQAVFEKLTLGECLAAYIGNYRSYPADGITELLY